MQENGLMHTSSRRAAMRRGLLGTANRHSPQNVLIGEAVTPSCVVEDTRHGQGWVAG